ncbi:MAG: helix-turn-helix domain-containing protein [Alistipes sp.]|uniref:helix-turn-helix domain-containing protein n=1 Tax=Alistipes sp. TaxID=1872444 RepID=UPI0025C04D5C|nr:helix-turn-helix domain-containing protein [Alistipes sp.]MCD8274620.1 helix-turn-helix domain-containing protein [Alistipes sp.]
MEQTECYKELKSLCLRILDEVETISNILQSASRNQQQEPEDVILDYQDVCQLLHISLRHLRRLYASGELVGFKLGRRRFYRTSEVRQYIRKIEETNTNG